MSAASLQVLDLFCTRLDEEDAKLGKSHVTSLYIRTSFREMVDHLNLFQNKRDSAYDVALKRTQAWFENMLKLEPIVAQQFKRFMEEYQANQPNESVNPEVTGSEQYKPTITSPGKPATETSDVFQHTRWTEAREHEMQEIIWQKTKTENLTNWRKERGLRETETIRDLITRMPSQSITISSTRAEELRKLHSHLLHNSAPLPTPTTAPKTAAASRVQPLIDAECMRIAAAARGYLVSQAALVPPAETLKTDGRVPTIPRMLLNPEFKIDPLLAPKKKKH